MAALAPKERSFREESRGRYRRKPPQRQCPWRVAVSLAEAERGAGRWVPPAFPRELILRCRKPLWGEEQPAEDFPLSYPNCLAVTQAARPDFVCLEKRTHHRTCLREGR